MRTYEMCAGSPGRIDGPHNVRSCCNCCPLGEVTPSFKIRPLDPIGNNAREYTIWVSKSRMISRRVCLDMCGPWAGIAGAAAAGCDNCACGGFESCSGDRDGSLPCPYTNCEVISREKDRRRKTRRRSIKHPRANLVRL